MTKAGLKPLISLEHDNHNEISKSIPLGFLSPISVQTNKATPLRKVFTKLRLNLGKRESRHLKTFSVSLQINNKTLTITLRHFAYKLLLEFKPGEKFVSLGKLICTILLDVKNSPSFQLRLCCQEAYLPTLGASYSLLGVFCCLYFKLVIYPLGSKQDIN